MTVLVVAQLHGLTGVESELRALLMQLADGARAEPGCAQFLILDGPEAGEHVLLSHWADEAALSAHYATPHYLHYRANVTPLLARPSDVVVHHVTDSVRAIDPNPPEPGRLG